jgi:hypothetical protein
MECILNINSALLPSLSAPYTYFHTLLDDPPVYVISSGNLFQSGIQLSLNQAQGRNFYIVVQPAWNFELHASRIAEQVSIVKKRNSNVRFMFMCPTMAELRSMRSLGLDAFMIHKNAFIDEKIFKPDETIQKKYSAIHVANTEKFKRHHLAWSIENIAVVTYSYRNTIDLSELSGYSHLGYANFSKPGIINMLPPSEICKIMCASGCGLVLSETEGANNASTEYLLCGIPVVSTPSRGGRDVFFDERYVRIVQPIRQEVERGVQYFNGTLINPCEIRNNVIEKMKVHRHRLITWLCMISGADLFASADSNYWIPQFTNKLRSTVKLDLHPSKKFIARPLSFIRKVIG